MKFDEIGAICVNLPRIQTRDPNLDLTPGSLVGGGYAGELNLGERGKRP